MWSFIGVFLTASVIKEGHVIVVKRVTVFDLAPIVKTVLSKFNHPYKAITVIIPIVYYIFKW